jgi:two-component system, cell cycle sensor histidine kinase and response regulator CckA
LLAFSRKQDLRFESLDFNMLIKDMTAMLRRIISEDIQLETRLAKELPPVHADAGMMGQVLLNLAVNARDAMPNGGKLVVTTEVVKVSSADSRRHPEARAGDFVCLSVQDNGCGMSPEVLARIFEPFFTTKGTGKGTGLGLATVHGVVKQHDGWLEVASQPGRGSTFSVFLPLTPEMVTAEYGTQAAAELHGGNETVLLVEDESSVRSLAALLLRRFGYHVLEAESGEKCLELLASTPEKIDLLVTDVVMPGKINGRELAEKAAALKPGLKAIFISGYDSDATSQQPGSRQGIDFLQKPFDPNELLRLVRSRLDAGK